MKKFFILLGLALASLQVSAQVWNDDVDPDKADLSRDLGYKVEMQGSFSNNKTPLWLNANKFGLSSLESNNGYLRAAIIRPLSADSTRRWGIGYGVDLVAPLHYTSKAIVQQAFVEARWLHGTLSVGSKEYPMELRSNRLSSGAQTLGINSRPVPQVRLALTDYWTVPILGRWFQLKGHIAYGKLTDDNWQTDFTQRKSKFSERQLYHSKAGYLRIGKDEDYYPLSLELGLEMAAIYGGNSYAVNADGSLTTITNEGGLKGAWHAFMPGGAESTETTYQNVSGNQLGSWLMRINYNKDTWRLRLYADKYFEDHSGMLLVDYDGYTTGEGWATGVKRKYFLYDLKDWQLGMEINLKYGSWLRDIVVEYMYTKYQSGPIYHDHTKTIADHIGGNDNFYNHYISNGWQHWGQVIGNPLFQSPIYNEDGSIEVKDNRFMAFHAGISGRPTENLQYRLLATYQEGLGTYSNPYTKKHHNVSFMLEADYTLPHNWNIKGAYGMDFGHILGHNAGGQITISKTGLLTKKGKKK